MDTIFCVFTYSLLDAEHGFVEVYRKSFMRRIFNNNLPTKFMTNVYHTNENKSTVSTLLSKDLFSIFSHSQFLYFSKHLQFLHCLHELHVLLFENGNRLHHTYVYVHFIVSVQAMSILFELNQSRKGIKINILTWMLTFII